MPQLKPVQSLQYASISNIVVNLDRHCQAYREMCKGSDRKNTSYKVLHRMYTEKMFQMLEDKVVVPDTVCFSNRKDFLDFAFLDETNQPEEDYLAFLFNPYCTKLDLSVRHYGDPYLLNIIVNKTCGVLARENFQKPGEIIPTANEKRTFLFSPLVIQAIQDIGQNLSVLNLQRSCINHICLSSLLKSLPNILSLNLSRTICSDYHLSIIREYCALLSYLDISDTSITDEGVKCLCANPSQRQEDACKITFLDVRDTDLTLSGVQIILESLIFLENFLYTFNTTPLPMEIVFHNHQHSLGRMNNFARILSTVKISEVSGAVPWILFHGHQQHLQKHDLANMRQYKLKEMIFCSIDMTEEILHFVLSCCPEVRSVIINCSISVRNIFLCTEFPLLTSIQLIMDELPSSQLLELFTLQGKKLEVVSLTGNTYLTIESFLDIFSWLEPCTKLRKFTLRKAVIMGNAFLNTPEAFDDALSKLSLPFTLTKVTLDNICDSSQAQFFSLFLLLANRVTVLRLTDITVVQITPDIRVNIDNSIEEVFDSYGFRYLRHLKLNMYRMNSDLLYRLFRINNLKSLEYPFSRFNRREIYERMLEMAKNENLNIDVVDKHCVHIN